MSAPSLTLLICLAALLLMTPDPTLSQGGNPAAALIGLAGLGVVTLRSEGRRRTRLPS